MRENPKGRTMSIKALACAAVIALSTLVANATSSPAPIKVVGPSFADVELASFTLSGISNVTGAVGFSPYVLMPSGFQILLPHVSFNSVSVRSAALALDTMASWSGNDFTFASLASGTYSLRTSGSLMGTNYIGAQFSVTLIPEPESFAMLLAGLGLVGALARRRNKIMTA